MQLKEIHTTAKKCITVLFALLYLFAPLHESILTGVHEISHALHQNSINHPQQDHHFEANKSHDHDHKVIAFFDSLFSSEKTTSETDKTVPTLEIDKHLTSEYSEAKMKRKSFNKQLFFHISADYKSFLKNPSPPPKPHFS
jgi:hypothetical protein